MAEGKPKPERFIITVEAIPWKADDRPAIYRLRALLKTLIRGYGFRCVELQEPLTPKETTNEN